MNIIIEQPKLLASGRITPPYAPEETCKPVAVGWGSPAVVGSLP
jgi:hypothetical protein